jgi:peroxiredoxin
VRQAAFTITTALVLSASFTAWSKDKPDRPDVGDRVEDFELTDPDGDRVRTKKLRKGKVFVLKFGATWCGWSTRMMPDLNRMSKEFAGKVAVLDVFVREPAERVRKHCKEKKVTYPTALDADGKVAAKYGVRALPVVLVVDRKGKVRHRKQHCVDYDALKRMVAPCLRPDRKGKDGEEK